MHIIYKCLFVACVLHLPSLISTAQAGLIEYFADKTSGSLTLSIEGNALRLTDHTSGPYAFRIIDTPGSGVMPAAQLGFASTWDTSSILSVPLQEYPLLPTTRLDGLFGGTGLGTSHNPLLEITIFTRSGVGITFDLDRVDVIGGTIPEPTSVVSAGMMGLLVLTRRFRVMF
jgi:hypothetical protein